MTKQTGKEIQKVVINFENGDKFTAVREEMKSALFEDLQTNLTYSSVTNSSSELLNSTVGKVFVELLPVANNFKNLEFKSEETNVYPDAFSRILHYKDIVSFTIYTGDKEENTYGLMWSPSSFEVENINQSACILEDGTLFLGISDIELDDYNETIDSQPNSLQRIHALLERRASKDNKIMKIGVKNITRSFYFKETDGVVLEKAILPYSEDTRIKFDLDTNQEIVRSFDDIADFIYDSIKADNGLIDKYITIENLSLYNNGKDDYIRVVYARSKQIE